ncbi:hypothetical protein N8844_06385 [Planktomarina temperata]|nr:hypothetical protein [Planktomarina temperata]
MNYIPLTLRALIMCFLLLSCTESGDVYNKNKHTKKDFSAEKTVGAILLGAAAVAAVAAGSDNDGFWKGVSEGMSDSPSSSKPASSSKKSSTKNVTSSSLSNSAVADDCSSSVQCGIGKKCVKKPGKARGICMQKVDKYGVKSFDMPDLDVGVRGFNEDQCNFNTDCQIGFSCDREYKVCVKR